ncbi:hypothetical protein NM208_g11407 [Fusarium decemcellulare]|uniref:Uncharacterized protein n=1 Tax=Fusarium decemcellulare TaxID=57161 RepID=A0ACC1RUI6_9HYPO|nr:hypothetical protein NM208_g11407 [Fusarium decemcellulare]
MLFNPRQKKAKPSPKKPKTATSRPAPLNQPLSVFAVGNGEMGELGLGPNQTETHRPLINPLLSKLQVIQLSCGGMHTVALTADSKIVTWGVNDNYALGRNTGWDGGLRDIDADSGDENGELNPRESTPTAIPASAFPSGTQFVQVAAGDSCTFALTGDGYVYGWGCFRVRPLNHFLRIHH